MEKVVLLFSLIVGILNAQDFDVYLKNFDYQERQNMKIE